MTVPDLLSTELFEEALQKYFKIKNIKVLEYSSKNAVPTGDNYTSSLVRATVTYRAGVNGNKETISLLIKRVPDNAAMVTLDKEVHLFKKEIEMFKTTFPAIYDVLGEDGLLSAKCIYSVEKPNTMLILEDLAPLGYKMVKRQEGLDLAHCLLVIEKIAWLHGASAVMYEKNPSLVTPYTEGLFIDTPMINGWIHLGFEALCKACKTWPGYEKYGKKLEALGDRIIKKSFAVSKRKVGGFNVLNHGDMWVNNMLFSYYPDGKLKNLCFVDFQLGFYSTPVIDLHYFLATSPRNDVRLQYLEIMLDHYYTELLATLARLKYSLERVPSKENFRKDFKARAFYGLLASATVTPLVKATSREDATFEYLMKSDEDGSYRHHCYNNETYKATLQQLLPFYDSLGVLD